MPNIKVRGLEPAQVQAVSGALTPALSKAIDCPIDWLTFCADGAVYCNGNPIKTDVFFQVEWFDRGEAVKDAVAKIITQGVKEMNGLELVETIAVIFVHTDGCNYYENGQHC